MAKLGLLAVLTLSSTQMAFAISASAQNQIVGVRLDDVARFLPNEIPDLKKSLPTIKRELKRLLDLNEEVEEIHDIFFNAVPNDSWFNSEDVLPITAFVKLSETGYAFVKGEIILKNSRIVGHGFETIPLENTDFKAEVGLIERLVILEDYSNAIKMVFPLGVGAFDEGVQNFGKTSLVTPRFKNAWLDKREAYASRTKPAYYAGKPFLRITTNQELDEGYTSIGFHAQPNLGPFLRGFDSHGCMRMQTDDLIAFHRLLSNNPRTHIPITVSYQVFGSDDHPAPKVDAPYKTIYNVGSRTAPYFKLDSDELIQLANVRSSAPIQNLYDSYDDDYFNLFDYDSRERLIPADGIPPQVDIPDRVDSPSVITFPRRDTTTRPRNDNDLPGVTVIRGGRSTTTTTRPRRTSPADARAAIATYCKRQFPYDTVFLNWERNRLIRSYNSCTRSLVNHYNSTGQLPGGI